MSSIGEAFAHDHRRIEQTLMAAMAHARAGQWQTAADAFAVFRRDIERHMEVEEQALFPAVEDGAETPLTAILRKGHRDLRTFFDEVDDALEARELDECARITASMQALLERHDKKEEAELYPVAQERLGADATAAITRLTD